MGNVYSKMESFFSKLRTAFWTQLSRRQLRAVRTLKPKVSKNSQLAAELKGQTIRVPNLDPLFDGWPMGDINPSYQKLRPFVDRKIDSFGFTGAKLAKFKGADLAMFVSCWWPKADLEACRTIALWIIWLFIWDDEIDLEENTVGSNFAAAQEFRCETYSFIEHCLGFSKSESPPEPPNAIIKSFEELGEHLRKYYDEEQRQRFLDEAKFYFDMTQLEQEIKFADRLPNLKEFWEMRMGSSAVKPCLVLAERAIGTKLPPSLMDHPDMEILWDETTVGISMSNDILSLKKELRSDGVLSVIPISYADCGYKVQTAVNNAVEALQRSIDRFDAAAKRIMLEAVEGTPEHRALADYVEVLKTNQTGHHYWSLRSGRYFLVGSVQEDGSLEITL